MNSRTELPHIKSKAKLPSIPKHRIQLNPLRKFFLGDYLDNSRNSHKFNKNISYYGVDYKKSHLPKINNDMDCSPYRSFNKSNKRNILTALKIRNRPQKSRENDTPYWIIRNILKPRADSMEKHNSFRRSRLQKRQNSGVVSMLKMDTPTRNESTIENNQEEILKDVTKEEKPINRPRILIRRSNEDVIRSTHIRTAEERKETSVPPLNLRLLRSQQRSDNEIFPDGNSDVSTIVGRNDLDIADVEQISTDEER